MNTYPFSSETTAVKQRIVHIARLRDEGRVTPEVADKNAIAVLQEFGIRPNTNTEVSK